MYIKVLLHVYKRKAFQNVSLYTVTFATPKDLEALNFSKISVYTY